MFYCAPLSTLQLGTIVRSSLLLLLGYPTILYTSKIVDRILEKHFSKHISMLVAHIIYYGGITLLLVSILHELGFNISALLGAAGIAGIAIGFAAQATISNVLSGLFLIVEKPFEVDDCVEWGDIQGTVHSIDLFSTKIRTTNNTLVRVSNHDLLKQPLVNISYFPVRSLTFELQVSKKDIDISYILQRINEIVRANKACLSRPVPQIFVHSVVRETIDSNSWVVIHLIGWVQKEQASQLKKELVLALYNAFLTEDIEVLIKHLEN